MIIYNKTWLANLFIQDHVNKDREAGHISKEEFKQVERAYPVGFYSPNIFIRIGLFILANIIISFAGGLFALFVSEIHAINPEIWLLVAGIACYFALEFMVKQNHHFRSGADDALLWLSGGMVFGALNLITDPGFKGYSDAIQLMFNAGFLFGISFYLSLRFADRMMATLSLLALFAFFGCFWISTGNIGTATLPFLMMILSAVGYFLSRSEMNRLRALHYQHCLQFVQVASLLVLYLSGNYYVVQQLGSLLLAKDGAYQVPMPYIFWIWTFVVPFVYIFFGVKRKDTVLLRGGLILLAAAGFTFRNYYHVMPVEATLVIIGIVILSASYVIIRYLKTPKNGITYEDLNEGGLADHLKIESLIVSEMPTGTAAPEQNRFGGGSFGGGGSSSDF